jgi:hypothetical protein
LICYFAWASFVRSFVRSFLVVIALMLEVDDRAGVVPRSFKDTKGRVRRRFFHLLSFSFAQGHYKLSRRLTRKLTLSFYSY